MLFLARRSCPTWPVFADGDSDEAVHHCKITQLEASKRGRPEENGHNSVMIRQTALMTYYDDLWRFVTHEK